MMVAELKENGRVNPAKKTAAYRENKSAATPKKRSLAGAERKR
jgi:hypothetical protein